MDINIVGIGSKIGSLEITNSDLEKMLNTTEEKIISTTGIKRRFHYDTHRGENIFTLGCVAVEHALSDANLTLGDVDGIFLSSNPVLDYSLPSPSGIIASLLGINHFYSWTGGYACAGPSIAMDSVFNKLSNPKMKNKTYVLIAGDQISSVLDPQSKDNILFTDAVSCLVVTNRQELDPYYSILNCNQETTNDSIDAFRLKRREDFLFHDGRKIFRFANKSVPIVASSLMDIRDFKDTYFIPHQANRRILENFRTALGLQKNQMYMNGEKSIVEIGNSGPASTFMALEDVTEKELASAYNRVVCVLFGEGLSVGVIELEKKNKKKTESRLGREDLFEKYKERFSSFEQRWK